jgi:hypothetical protein
MICGFIGMRSLQNQFAPELPMVGTCDLWERDSTKEVKGSAFTFADTWTEFWIGYRTFECIICEALFWKGDYIVALATGRCASPAIWPCLVTFDTSDWDIDKTRS